MLITLTTDFGDFYPAEMKGVIHSINPDARIIDITHSVRRHSIIEASFLLSSAVEWFPENSIHVCVVDPGVGGKRKPILVECNKTYFVGPDNGVLIPAARKKGEFRVYEIKKRFFEKISCTFHGRDVFAPTAAYLSMGASPEDMGQPTEEWADLDIFTARKRREIIQGMILYSDRFGNVITNISSDMLKDVRYIYLKNRKLPFVRFYEEVPQNSPLAIIGSHDLLEISVNRGSAEKMFGLRPGDEITLKLEPY